MSKQLKPPVNRPPSEAAIHKSYWLQRHALKQQCPQLRGDHETEILVIGAGITGLSIALELLSRGHAVTVCESNIIGAGTTGGSSGHLDAHPEMGPRQLIKQLGEEAAISYMRHRADVIDTIESRGGERCGFVRTPAYY